jgi:hypothetical protein
MTDAVPAAVRASWEQAESQLYQVVMTRPDLYQRAVVLVGRLSAVLLEECPDPAALMARAAAEAERGWPVVESVAAEAHTPTNELDVGMLGRATCAMAGRRLAAAVAAGRRRERLAAAGGETWVVVEESGDPAGVAWAPYRRIEVRSDTGRGVLVTTEPDDDLVGVVHRVRGVVLDLATGEVGSDGEPAAPASLHADAADRERAVDDLKSASDQDR